MGGRAVQVQQGRDIWRGGFVQAPSLIGYLIEQGLLGHELIRQHLVKPLIAHHYTDNGDIKWKAFRTMVLYQLFVTEGDVLLRGLLEPEEKSSRGEWWGWMQGNYR